MAFPALFAVCRKGVGVKLAADAQGPHSRIYYDINGQRQRKTRQDSTRWVDGVV